MLNWVYKNSNLSVLQSFMIMLQKNNLKFFLLLCKIYDDGIDECDIIEPEL